MYNVVRVLKDGNTIQKNVKADNIVFAVGNAIVFGETAEIYVHDILLNKPAFYWSDKSYYSLNGTLANQVKNYIEKI